MSLCDNAFYVFYRRFDLFKTRGFCVESFRKSRCFCRKRRKRGIFRRIGTPKLSLWIFFLCQTVENSLFGGTSFPQAVVEDFFSAGISTGLWNTYPHGVFSKYPPKRRKNLEILAFWGDFRVFLHILCKRLCKTSRYPHVFPHHVENSKVFKNLSTRTLDFLCIFGGKSGAFPHARQVKDP